MDYNTSNIDKTAFPRDSHKYLMLVLVLAEIFLVKVWYKLWV